MAVATDNFNRADGGLGANWTTCPSHSALAIVSNTCQSSATSVFCAGLWNAATFIADHYSQAVIGTAPTSGSEAVGVIVRAKTGVDEFYLAFISDSQWQLYQRSGGAYALKGGTTSAASSGDIIKLEAIGSGPVTVNLYKNGGLITTYTTSGGDAVITGGSAGILIYDTGHSLSVDDWEGGTTTTTGAYIKGNFLAFM